MRDPDELLSEHTTRQFGGFTVQQADACGLDARQLRSRVQSGRLEQTGVQTYRSSLTPSTPLGELCALVLDLRSPSWVSGTTGVGLYGIDGYPIRAPFHITVERGRFPQRGGMALHTSANLDAVDKTSVQGIPCLTMTRLIIDLARILDHAQLALLLAEAIAIGRTSEDHVHRRLHALRGRGRHGTTKLLEVLANHEIVRGGESFLERELLRILADAGFPRPETQQVLGRAGPAGQRLIRVDCRFPSSPVVVEALGYRFHRTPQHMRRDAERMNVLVAQGFIPVQLTYSQVMEGPATVVPEVQRAFDAAARRSWLDTAS
jgi:very-short-patch-repair endonuclease